MRDIAAELRVHYYVQGTNDTHELVGAAADRIAALEARCRVQDEEIGNLNEWYDRHQKRIAELEAALRSIAANTCCGQCQAAALVAKAVLHSCGLTVQQRISEHGKS